MRQLACASILLLAACGGGGSGTGPNPPGGGTGTFTAVIDGQSWVSTTNQTTGAGSGSNAIPGAVTIIGTNVVSATNYTSLVLNLGYLTGPGTYPLGVNFVSTAGGGATVTRLQGSALSNWSTEFPGNAGTVTVTGLSASRIVGTFQFSALPQAFTGATGTRVVTNGVIDMPLPAGFTVAPASNKGSKVTATIGGTAWNAATIVAGGSNNVLSLGATSDSYSLTITPGTVVSAGNTYPIGGGSGSMLVTRTGTGNNWTSGTGGQVGSITITTFSGGRATGTFSAILVPGSTTTGSLVITNGTFDVRVDPL
jgi:hypothetical protein